MRRALERYDIVVQGRPCVALDGNVYVVNFPADILHDNGKKEFAIFHAEKDLCWQCVDILHTKSIAVVVGRRSHRRFWGASRINIESIA